MDETKYQHDLKKRISNLFPGCVILNNDPSFVQGIPDILVLYKDKWAMLEVKASASANVQPNQEYYIRVLGDMSFASFINPENEKEVLDELQHSFGTTG